MQKFVIITLFVLISSVTVAAQTAAEQVPLSETKQVGFAQRVEAVRKMDAPAAPILNAGAKRRQVERIVDGRVLRLGPTTTYLKNGLSADEVIRLLGKPASISERRDGNRLLIIYTFPRSDGRLFIAEFENGLLVNSRTEPVTK